MTDRIHCSTCAHFNAGHCQAHEQIGAAPGYMPVIQPRRCIAYQPLPGDPDQRTGKERWPWLVRVVPLDVKRVERFKEWRFDQEWKPEHDRDAYGSKLKPGT